MHRNVVIWTGFFVVTCLAACSSSSSTDPDLEPGPDGAGYADSTEMDVVSNTAEDTGPSDASLDTTAADIDVETTSDTAVDADDTTLDVADTEADVAERVDVIDDTRPDSADSGASTRDGFGTITGECGVLSPAVLADPTPRIVRNRIDFADDPFDDSDIEALTDGGYEVYTDPNAGGSSILSETFAFEMLARCDGAVLRATELEVSYDPITSAKTDFVVAFDEVLVGVSVTRAVTFPRDAPLGIDEAMRRVTDKLEDVIESTANVVGDVTWDRQILHVIAWGPEHADDVAEAWEAIDADVRADTLLVVTISDGDDAFLY